MANFRSFKSDTSFLQKISIGAIGTRRVLEDLRSQGHNPIELERGSTSFKIWKRIKIKRIRVPDILCVNCGRRVESRAKTNPEISMSHSVSDPERGWDYGLKDNDFVALIVCKRSGNRPIDWQADELVQYISIQELRVAQKNGWAIFVKPKGAEEGFESRATWPAVIASFSGTVVSVNEKHIQYRRHSDNRLITLKLEKQGLRLEPLINKGSRVLQNQVLASVVPVVRLISCAKSVTYKDYLSYLSSPLLSDRYTAAKALSLFRKNAVSQALLTKVNEDTEHIYVRLEAAASLASRGEEKGWLFINQCLANDYLQNRLEAIIVLAEIPSERSCRLLSKVLKNHQQHPEIRAGAAWALGEIRNKLAINVLIDSFTTLDEGIRIEGARALAKLSSCFSPEVLDKFSHAEPDKRPGIAWAISKSGEFELENLLETLVDNDARQWVPYILGTQEQQKYISKMEKIKERDPEVYFATTVLWKIMTSWIWDLEEY